MIQTIDGVQYLNMLRGGAQNLNRFRTEVNDLNVFPIPDGDTGDNMFMTVNAGAVKAQENVSVAVTADSAAQEMLMGARGNSGVILSRIFAGIAKGMNNADHLNTDGFTEAMRMGVTESYGAVSTPVEGTILTVYREGVEKVEEKHPRSFEELFELLLAELKESLEHTPELLDVLKEAGVVDSGGAGLLYIVQGMKEALSGKRIDTLAADGAAQQNQIDLNAFTEDSELEFGYCTEFLLRLQNSKVDIDNFDVDGFTAWLNSVGDSVVCFKEGSIVKAHVHTKRPGDILNHCQQYGEFLTTKIENMTLQHNGSHGMQELKLKKRKPQKPYGIVTVASGDGLKELFVSLGCDVVVDGGQSMNPSTEDLIRAFDECSAETIYVFPNNSNIILTAQQAAQLYDNADVRIVLTKTIGEGYSAISMFDLSAGDPDAVTESLNELIKGVVTGMVSRASRDVSGGAVEVVKDDYIGFVGDEIYVDEPNAEDAMIALCDKLNAGNYDILLILAGKEPSADNARKMVDTLSEKYKRSEVIMVNGDQPIYDYILILE
ncbi:DAK2 domain-containing protein [Ruminococcus sp.]|uniref:DAK2 domain-containing protein n=1 Tax=Ruminococcus sp. TaxID=41978 RepID=UPI002E800BD1|nr:DAK2 domain-containing protein [Ruminococcus sp.]MEE3492065.1 DAK2 domain-containing protein [Ruminococcus sp.]